MAQTLAESAAIPYGQALTAEEMEYLTQELFKLAEETTLQQENQR